MEEPNLDTDGDTAIMVDNNVHPNVEELHLDREELFGYIGITLILL